MGSPTRSESRPDRPRVRISGTVQNIRHARIGGMPALEADLLPVGRSRIELVWLGRDAIPGIEPGSMVAVEGRVAVRRGRDTLYNPRYELAASAMAS
ncbi:MAG TPA: DNA-binding protein [Streptosporangiaceae bacterium]